MSISDIAGRKPYRPGTGTEGIEFEDAVCGTCDRYRPSREAAPHFDCTLDLLTAAYCATSIKDPAHPWQWVYGDDGRPTCLAWLKRTYAADIMPPVLCGGATTPEAEQAAYDRAMRGE